MAAFKPVVTGLDEDPGDWPHDHDLLASVATAGQRPEDVAPHRFGPAASPHYAAELAGTTIEPGAIASAASAAARDGVLIVEGVGGLMVPLTPGYLVRDLAIELRLPLIVVARTGLGTINHTLLSVEAARAGGLTVVGIVMTPWAGTPRPIERSNRATVERLSGVTVSTLEPVRRETLAVGGGGLPIAEWLP